MKRTTPTARPVKPSYTAQIATIVDEFDFARVESMMRAVGWRWSDGDWREYAPDRNQLKRCAIRLLECVADADKGNGDPAYQRTETGGFMAVNNDGLLRLSWGLEQESWLTEHYWEQVEDYELAADEPVPGVSVEPFAKAGRAMGDREWLG